MTNMSQDPLERLANMFEKFPGIGPRQASRFVQYLVRQSPSARRDLIDAINEIGRGVRQCPVCMRFHAGEKPICSICGNTHRDRAYLAIVAHDTDLLALERSGTYHGMYFVLGGTIALTNEKTNGLRLSELVESLQSRIGNGLAEIILAFPANPEGDATADAVHATLREWIEGQSGTLKITSLGRGLSTGSELEYADPETLKSALDNRR